MLMLMACIIGLIINFFDVTFPSLLSRDFIVSMKTPIVTISKGVSGNANKQTVFTMNAYIKSMQMQIRQRTCM